MALIIRIFLIPHTHIVYFDEFDHINVAQNIRYSNRFCECSIGNNTNCVSCYLYPFPPGYHYIQGTIFRIFGDTETVAFNTNAIVGGLSIIIIFLIIYTFTKNQKISITSSFSPMATVVEAFLLTNACPAKRVTDVICDGTMVCAKAAGWPM